MTYRSRRSSTPDISLPPIKNRNWANFNRILCIDESLNNSGAAMFVDGAYRPRLEDGIDVGLSLKQSISKSQQEKIVAYHQWVASLLESEAPDVVIGESHPFIRGNKNTSIATLEVLSGVRYVTMLACGQARVPYAEFSTNHVKLVMCDSSSASKEMIQLILKGCGYMLPVYKSNSEVNDNVCDAIAMGEVITRMQKQEVIRQQYAGIVGDGRSQTRLRRKQNGGQ